MTADMARMGWVETLAFFGSVGVAMALLFQLAMPRLLAAGWPEMWAFFAVIWGPVLYLLAGVAVAWRRSGTPFTAYFRIGRLSVGWCLGLIPIFLGLQLLEAVLGSTALWLTRLPGWSAPDHTPQLFRPGFEPELPLQTFLGADVPGNFGLLAFWALWLAVNIGGEELLWRGYALPRMELAFGRWAWLINGLCWILLIHLFMRWSYVAMAPTGLLVPYLCQRTRSIWPGILLHGAGNALVYVLLVPSVLQGG